MSVENRKCSCMNENNMNNNLNYNCECQNDNCMMNENVLSANEIQNDCNCEDYKNTREEMAKKIKCLDFAVIELSLYLDTHPDDQKALCLHRKYAKEVKELKDDYQKVYGPLTINYPCNKWRWLEEPWPSFILGEVTTYL